jgi:hypothetical protein
VGSLVWGDGAAEHKAPSKTDEILNEWWSFAKSALYALFAIYCLSFVLIFVDIGKKLAVVANRTSLMAVDLSKLTPAESE